MRPMNALDSHFVNSIKARGPMSVAVWMKDCLTYPRFGYYTKAASPANVLGRTGDFVTSVEMSPVFCGMVGGWLVFVVFAVVSLFCCGSVGSSCSYSGEATYLFQFAFVDFWFSWDHQKKLCMWSLVLAAESSLPAFCRH
jgi:hypothetical protein